MELLLKPLLADGFYYRWDVGPDSQRLLYLFWNIKNNEFHRGFGGYARWG
ncbi:hypothetical protein L917_02528 [Phytophthora nicotianae]|uniref:Uncharacterized protein n=1 Tax=Phytophthora nicotianae TaxID=4792 RepID=W2LTH1_PHYNI|nr:hypothetical protein L917_02528 [Phytophthora nicotianae]